MGHKQRTLSLDGVTLKETNLSFGSVSTSVIPQDSDEAEKAFLLCSGEKKMGPNQLFLVWCLIMVEISFSLNTNNFFLVSEKKQVSDPADRDIGWHQHGHISCFNH